ncbi:Histone acetyltransferase HPA2 and related acetyltransferases [Microbacterium esteraromaticum]|uniref:Histone acetyltransferase HPA2 and related acetyltransferases n=1 Tax=Microbacterium esteraromaticum TaxID=57043 RepID=A0A1R4KE44_9MICO|nr:GNAT family N-acetyltransferase [Microbacterium esteraromaticum]SJN42394.1 Histone acetyltransferase HPA2 and related acetyltransferases [Microbacterium esteraromaticum]
MLDALVLPQVLPSRADSEADGPVILRRATAADVEGLIALLADDPISASRGDIAAPDDHARYAAALRQILGDPSNDLLVAERADAVVGTFQLTLIPGMARRGSWRLLVEAVRVRSDLRSAGIGSAMMRWVTDEAASRLGADLVQLTSDAARVEAHRFYERLGFAGSHLGFKYPVRPSSAGVAEVEG